MRRYVPTAATLAAARRIVTRPRPEDRAQLRLIAWAILKSTRGQTVRQSALPGLCAQAIAGPSIAPPSTAILPLRGQIA